MADAEAHTSKPTRERSPSFPFISLKTAISRLQEFEGKFGRQEPTADRAYLAWGMKGDTSQAQQTIAALKSFGLVDYKGVGPKRLVSISDDGRKYLRAQQDSIKQALLKRLALKPKWIAHFWGIWGMDKVPNEIRLDALVLDRKFNENAAPNFLRVYDETIAYAGLGDSDKVPSVTTEDEDEEEPPVKVEVGDLVNVERDGALVFPAPVRVREVKEQDGQIWVWTDGSNSWTEMETVELVNKGPGSSPRTTPPPPPSFSASQSDRPILKQGWREERLLDEAGEEIFISYKGDPSQARYEFIRDYLDFKLDRMRAAGGGLRQSFFAGGRSLEARATQLKDAWTVQVFEGNMPISEKIWLSETVLGSEDIMAHVADTMKSMELRVKKNIAIAAARPETPDAK